MVFLAGLVALLFNGILSMAAKSGAISSGRQGCQASATGSSLNVDTTAPLPTEKDILCWDSGEQPAWRRFSEGSAWIA